MPDLGNLGHYNRSFLFLAGLLSGLSSGGACWLLMTFYGLHDSPYRLSISAIVGGTAFLVFFPYRQLISARTLIWMLGQATIRWLRVAAMTMLLFFLFISPDAGPAFTHKILLQWAMGSLSLQWGVLALLRTAVFIFNDAQRNRRTAVFVGLGPEAARLARRLLRSRILGIEPTGYYAEQPQYFDPEDTLTQLRYLGTYHEATQIPESHRNHMVFLAMTGNDRPSDLQALTEHLYDSTGDIYFIPEPELSEGFAIHSVDIAGVPLLALHETSMLGLPGYLKRAMDLLLVGLALLMLWPVLLLIALAIKLDSPGPVLYPQERYGQYGQRIIVYKFRSMRTDADQSGLLQQARKDDRRVTRVGHYLRRFSLDELPQLFNVLNGSMSLVGPRPHATSHNELYRHKIRGYMLRHTVKPGITGWAQVNGLRGETDTLEKMQRRVEYDRYYIIYWSLTLDLKILFKTVWIVLWDKNAY